jgi:hypothetical protein
MTNNLKHSGSNGGNICIQFESIEKFQQKFQLGSSDAIEQSKVCTSVLLAKSKYDKYFEF